MAKAIVKLNPYTKLPLKFEKFATLASWLEFQEGMGTSPGESQPQPETPGPRGQGHSPSKGRADSGNDFHLVPGTLCLDKQYRFCGFACKGRKKDNFITQSIMAAVFAIKRSTWQSFPLVSLL